MIDRTAPRGYLSVVRIDDGMRIGVNLIPLRPGQMGGHEFYVRRLLEPLLAQGPRDQYVLFTAPWNDEVLDFRHGNYRKILAVSAEEQQEDVANASQGMATGHFTRTNWQRVRQWWSTSPRDLHEWARRLRLDLWFCPITNLEPRQLPIPTVVTVADIQQEYYPEFFTHDELSHRALMYLPSCQEATAVITVSNASKQSLLEKYGLPAEKVHCIYEAGVEGLSKPVDRLPIEAMRRKYSLPDTYAFYPANLWPHKNHELLILGLHRLRESHGITLPLVLTGDKMDQWPALERLARHFELQKTIRHLGYVQANELPHLYAGATLMVFPSLFEGFGIPLVEAMALGCPIAAANRTSIPEVVGEAAVLFDPRSPDSLADALSRLLSDAALRRALVERGHAQAALYSWKKVAQETRQVFDWARSHYDTLQHSATPRRAPIEGLYPDGWARRKMRLDLPSTEDVEAIRLEGWSGYLPYPVTLQMKASGRKVAQLRLEQSGPFALVGPSRRHWRFPARLAIEVVANDDFSPQNIGLNSDPRHLAYLVERLVLICRGGNEVPLYTRPPSIG